MVTTNGFLSDRTIDRNNAKVKCNVQDSKIWDLDVFVMNLMETLQRHGEAIIDLCNEGPCCKSLGLDELLEKIVAVTGIDRDKIIIHTSNWIKSSQFNEQHICTLDQAMRFISPRKDTIPTDFDRHFGIFISRSNWKRLALSSYIWNNHRDKSIQTFHFDPESDYHRANFGLETYLFTEWHDKKIFDFLQNLPIKFGDFSYPIIVPVHDLNNLYDQIFCDVVCETFFSGKTFFLTEKTWRPIINKKPFVVQGPQWFLENLRRLGFKTFASWWSEGYDEEIDGGTLMSIQGTLDYIASQNHTTLQKWYQEMQPILDHNLKILLNLTSDQKVNTYYKIPE